MAACPSCADIAQAEARRNPWAIARLQAGYVMLNPCQYYEGATFYVAKSCVAELHELDPQERQLHLVEMAGVAAAVFEEFGARKMNYEALGNMVAHLHWWLTPRHHDDRRPNGPIWEDLDFLRQLWTKQAVRAADLSDDLRRRVLRGLQRQSLVVEAAFV
jgi:diadenosine tetraphosphate (Ap4A) HIT family hydrolase